MAKKDKQTPKSKVSRPGKTEGALLSSTGRRLQRYRTAVLVAIQAVLIFIVFLQVNYLSCRRHSTWDLTQNRRFTVSDTTKNYLGSLGGEVRLVMAFLGTSELHSEVKGVSAEYLDLSRSRSRIAELKDKHQLQFSGDQIVVFGESGRIKTISAEELVGRDANSGRVVEFKGEEVLTAAILEVTEQKQRKIYLVTGDRRADELVPIAEQLQPLANAQNARLEGLVIEGREEIPADADALFFPGNSEDLTERELTLVRDYWESRRGGLVIFLDPNAETPVLNSLLREHGVAPRPDRVLSVVSIPGVAARKTYDVPVSLMPGPGPTRDLPALSTRLIDQTQSIEVLYEDDLLLSENIRPLPLMIAATGFWGETDYQAEEISFTPGVDRGQPDPVFTAASVEKGVQGDPGLSQGSSRLVVVGNANVISPEGNSAKVAADFTMASLNWVMNREELMGISPRRPTFFTLSISPDKVAFLQSLLIMVLPGAALILGGFVWMRRRA
ncbi:MAG: GldG family protein [Verrucomicrobiales bacterium]|nr:GldG family protein [Verrucomicrobiales bacterium]